MRLVAALKPFFRPPDPRSEREIDRDLDEEFAFHLEQIERELTDADPTLSHDEAARLAQLRFGDTDQLKQRCRRIAMEDRIMLQRINAVLMVVVMLMVIGVSIQMYLTQRQNSVALLDITTQLAKMRVDAAAEARDRGWTAEGSASTEQQGDTGHRQQLIAVPLRFVDANAAKAALITRLGPLATNPDKPIAIVPDDRTNSLLIHADPSLHTPIMEAIKDIDLDAAGKRTSEARDAAPEARILVQGDIERPGWFGITLDEVTYVADLLRLVGARPDQWISSRTEGDAFTNYFLASFYYEGDGQRTIVRPGREYIVADSPLANQLRSLGDLLHRDWVEVDDEGRIIEGGWQLTRRSLSNQALAATLSREEEAFDLGFAAVNRAAPRHGSPLSDRNHVSIFAAGQNVRGGAEWDLVDGRLIIYSIALPRRLYEPKEDFPDLPAKIMFAALDQ